MRKIFARSRSLLVIVALVTVAALSGVSAADAASSSPDAGNAAQARAASSAQCNLRHTISKCQSTDPTVTLSTEATGGTGGIVDCTFVWDITWGDGQSAHATLTDPHVGWKVIAQHTYLIPNTYTVTATGLAIGTNCTLTPFVVTFTLLASPPAPPPCPAVNNTVWNGYAVCGRNFGGVSARWTVPAAHGGGNKKAAFWVGLGGLGSNTTLAQDGTESNVVNGKAVYTAWWEFVPSPPVFLSRVKYPVHAGDVMHAAVTVTNGDHYHYKLEDYGTGGKHRKWSWTFEETIPGGTHASAEVIAEDTGQGPLTNFGSVTFSHVAVDGNVMAAYGAHKFTAPGGKVSVSGIGDTAKFLVTFKHS